MAADNCEVRPTVKNINGMDISLAREVLVEHEAREAIEESRGGKKPMNKYLKRVLFFGGCAVAVIGVSAGMTCLRDMTGSRPQEPTREPEQFKEFQSPMGYGIPYQDVVLNGANGTKLRGWVFKSHFSKPTIVYMHGAHSDVAWSMPQLVDMYRETGCNLVVLNYRKGGLSRHTGGQADAMDDMASALKEVKAKLGSTVDTSKLFLMGQGIGANVAVEVARQHNDINGMILENPRQAAPGSRVRTEWVNTFRYVCPDWLRNCLTEVKPSAQEVIKTLSVPTMLYTNSAASHDNAVEWFRFTNAEDVVLLQGGEGAAQRKFWHEAIASFTDSVAAKQPIGVQVRNFIEEGSCASQAA